MTVLQGVRYVDGAPDVWSGWLNSGDLVELEVVPAAPGTVPAESVNRMSLANDLVVRAGNRSGLIPFNHIVRIDVGDGPPEALADRVPRGGGYDPGEMPYGLGRLRALRALPRQRFEWLAIALVDRTVRFDVADRHWPEENLISDAALHSLEFVGDQRVFIRDRTYRWIIASRFQIPANHSDAPLDILRTLIDHPYYWHSYLTSRDTGIHPGIHGPYRMEAITVGSFEPHDPQQVTDNLAAWLHDDHEVSPEQIDGDLTAIHRHIATAARCYQLGDLGEGAYHDTGWILTKPFLEHLLVGPGPQLVVLVASGS